MSVTERASSGAGPKGSPLRELHNAVFDAMERGRGGTIRVGMGSAIYGFVGTWIPRGLVGWIMGIRKVDKSNWAAVESESSSDSSKEDVGMAGESEYVSIDQRS
jgi:hypothetical protein